MTIKVGIIGASFAKAAYLPALANIPDAEVVAIASNRLESAQAAADAFNVPNAYDNWERMLDSHELELVGIATPPIYHADMALKALDNGAHVLCEKPMAMDADESQKMLDRAVAQGKLHIMGHELRFNPTRKKLKSLLDEGAIGQVQFATVVNISPSWGDPASRPYNDWWSDVKMGGGRLGANGSHQIDLIRWWLGDIGAINGDIRTLVPNRIGKDNGESFTATADDYTQYQMEMQSGAVVNMVLTGAARHNMGNHVQIFGTEGTILLSNSDEVLRVARAGEDFEQITFNDPNAALPYVGKGIWNVSFVALMQELTAAIREERALNEGATFEDGLATQLVMDAVRQSSVERRWIQLD
ncbi:MAG: Gfo/Idh/MocA family oxidoreductase [Chloroflexota bacterium]